jgi:tetratricopeptide (TPR) repeat protein
MNDDGRMTGGRALQATLTLALTRFNERRFSEAEALYRQVLEQRPRDADALNMLGLVFAEAGNPLLALKHIDQALALDPGRAAFHTNRGEILRRWGLPDEALDACRRAHALDPHCAEVQNNLGLALLARGAFEEALPHIQAAIGLRPQMPEAHFNLGRALKGIGEWQAALDALRTAVAHAPAYAEAWHELASVQERTDDPQASLGSCERALGLRGDFAEAWVARGDALTSLGDIEGAVASYRAALRINGGFAVARYQLALALLGRGAYAEGWQHYEARLDPSIPGAVSAPMMPMPQWQGEPIAGKRLLVLTEQGYGDHIQFARFVPRLAQQGVEVVLGASPEMGALSSTVRGVERVVTQVDDAWASGAHCWTFVGSLPLRLGVGEADLGMSAPYVAANAGRVAAWRDRLAALDGACKVGLVWAGRAEHGNDWRRSIPFGQLAPLGSVPGVALVSVQVGGPMSRPDESAQRLRILDAGPELRDFAETAALLCALDLLITVDSAPAHLAGALGRPVWNLLAFAPDWRWRGDDGISRWYPTMRLFRQTRRGDWSEVIERVTRALADRVSAARRAD